MLSLLASGVMLVFMALPYLRDREFDLQSTVLIVSVCCIFGVVIGSLYFYRRFYLWFAGVLALLAGLLLWTTHDKNGPLTEIENFALDVTPIGLILMFAVMVFFGIKQRFFGENLVSDKDDIHIQGLHPSRQDLLRTVALFVIAVIFAVAAENF